LFEVSERYAQISIYGYTLRNADHCTETTSCLQSFSVLPFHWLNICVAAPNNVFVRVKCFSVCCWQKQRKEIRSLCL